MAQDDDKSDNVRDEFLAEAQEIVPASTYHALMTLEPLKRHRSEARETKKVVPVDWKTVQAAIAYMPRYIAGLVLLQWWSAMRPSEALTIRMRDIDRTGKVWLYRPVRHKSKHHDRERVIVLVDPIAGQFAPKNAGECVTPIVYHAGFSRT